MGAEACQSLNYLTVNMEYVLGVNNSMNNSVALTVEQITDKYRDVFEGYGRLAGEIHLVTDPTVQPVIKNAVKTVINRHARKSERGA